MNKRKLNPLLARKAALYKTLQTGGQLTAEEAHFLSYGTLDFNAYSGEQLAEWFLDEDGTGALDCQAGLKLNDYADVVVRLAQENAYSFTKLIRQNWNAMDDFYHLTEDLRALFRKHFGDEENVCNINNRKWWDKQPETLKVFRGCEADRWDGLSWTLDRKVATSYAKGHKGIKLKNPIVASTTIPKSFVLFCTNDLGEQEVVWDVKVALWKGEIKKMPYKGNS